MNESKTGSEQEDLIKTKKLARLIVKQKKMIFDQWECLVCGFCCTRFRFGMKGDDLERWDGLIVDSNIGRYPLRDFVNFDSHVYSKMGDLFFHPETKEWLFPCPFLGEQDGKHPCLIHDSRIKPNVCKDWHSTLIDLRCRATRQIVKRKFGLKFKDEDEEYQYFKQLNVHVQQFQHEQLFGLSLKILLDLCKNPEILQDKSSR
ncbi:MAG: YkgJ family cysteine cluster protein [Candidatus Helarchaeota archaeon]